MTGPQKPTEPQKPTNRVAKETVVDGAVEAQTIPAPAAHDTIPEAAHPEAGIPGPDVHEPPIPEPMAVAQSANAAQPIARYAADAPVHRVAADSRGRTLNEADFKKLSRRSLLTGAGGAIAAFVGWRTLQGRPERGNIPDVLRIGHETSLAHAVPQWCQGPDVRLRRIIDDASQRSTRHPR